MKKAAIVIALITVLLITFGCKSGAITTPTTITSTNAVTPPTTVPSSTSTTTASTTTMTPITKLTIVTTSLSDGYVGAAYSQTLQASGGTGTYTWWLSSGSLPTGLTLNASSGVISGTPKAAATSFFTVHAVDNAGVSGIQTLLITVNLPSTTTTQAATVTITTTSLPAGYVATAYSRVLQASGGSTIYSWSTSNGSLPDGLVLDAATGIISGTPKTATTSSFTAEVTDSTGATATQSLSITINAAPTTTTQASNLSITTTSFPAGHIGIAYSQSLQASGSTGPYIWSYSGGPLPDGLMLDANTGIIFGTPTAIGTSNFTVQTTDSTGATAAQFLSITIIK